LFIAIIGGCHAGVFLVFFSPPSMVTLPSNFNFYSSDEMRRYYASDRAIDLAGHDSIVFCIEVARSHETGAIRDYNADEFPIDGRTERLFIVRSRDETLILALVDDELPPLQALFAKLFRQPSSTGE
jgi:hypothetical protein